jgi:hypothetical protein
MGRQRWPKEFDERRVPPGPRREPPSRSGGPERAATPLEPIARSVLYLQSTAGNSAVSTSIRAVVQRQPKPKKQPQWVIDAQVAFDATFPNMKGVVIKNFAELNATLQKSHYGAWTQSKTEIYLKDPTKPAKPKDPAPTKAVQTLYVRYLLEHEAVHIRQFINPGGPPKTWEQMLLFEKEAYTKDKAWLRGPGEKIITIEAVFDDIEATIDKNRNDIDAVLGLTGVPREEALHKGMLANKLIPPGTDPDAQKLYIQP